MDNRTCPYCNTSFIPNKYSPDQKICSSTACQKKRQLHSMELWRQKNPNYFKYDESKGLVWLETQRRRSKTWRERNPDKIRNYRYMHSKEYRDYMKDYMRRYRERRKNPTPPSSPSQAPTNG